MVRVKYGLYIMSKVPVEGGSGASGTRSVLPAPDVTFGFFLPHGKGCLTRGGKSGPTRHPHTDMRSRCEAGSSPDHDAGHRRIRTGGGWAFFVREDFVTVSCVSKEYEETVLFIYLKCPEIPGQGTSTGNAVFAGT